MLLAAELLQVQPSPCIPLHLSHIYISDDLTFVGPVPVCTRKSHDHHYVS